MFNNFFRWRTEPHTAVLTLIDTDKVLTGAVVAAPAATGLAVQVSSGLVQISKVTYFSGANATLAIGAVPAATGQSRTDLVFVDNTGVVQVTAGTAAVTGTQVAPVAAAGQIPLATVTVAHGDTTVVQAGIAYTVVSMV